MSSKSEELAIRLMSKIDDIKDNITDGDYLDLCNMLKALNDNIKNNKQDNNNDESDNESESGYASINEAINDFFNMRDRTYNPQLELEDNVLTTFNNFIKNFEDDEETPEENRQWFMCPCGCSVCSNAISEHIQTDDHNLNFRSPV